ncbi:MAG: TIGR03617 family F420-dependent LLM class oxidoreductase [Acidimicrobiia bacterium]|nr:TIGR03617 family F420-dependent LLM class oxidoreductase [Acidimicrobiia bacterium]
MQVETLLPLGKVDPGLRAPEVPFDITTVGEQARLVEELGYDRLVFEETKDDPFVVLAAAAQATSTLGLGTSVAIAFPRSPTSMALTAWSMQRHCAGRFALGLGSQVKGHIERRYGMAWRAPAPWMRDYVRALRAVWRTWQDGVPLAVDNDHYRLSLMVPLFDAGPIDHPDIPVLLAAVNPLMCSVAGEVADGIRPHPVCTPSYIEQVMLPAVGKGAGRAGRALERFSVNMKPLVATAPDEERLLPKVRDARARIAFYASTPSYRAPFDHLGLGALADEAKALSKAQRWEELPPLIDDDVLHTFVTIGTYDEIGARLHDRFGQVVTHCEFSVAVGGEADRSALAAMVDDLHARDDTAARATIAG